MSLRTVTGRKLGNSRFYVLRGSDIRNISKGQATSKPAIHILDRRFSHPNKAHQSALDGILKPSQQTQSSISNSLSVASNVVKMHPQISTNDISSSSEVTQDDTKN